MARESKYANEHILSIRWVAPCYASYGLINFYELKKKQK